MLTTYISFTFVTSQNENSNSNHNQITTTKDLFNKICWLQFALVLNKKFGLEQRKIIAISYNRQYYNKIKHVNTIAIIIIRVFRGG